MCYNFVLLQKEDVPALVELEQLCFKHPWTEAMFCGEFENPVTVYFGVTKEETLVAYMGLWCVGEEGQITNVAVHPEHRRQGLAVRLIKSFIKLAKERKMKILTLEVREENIPAISLYQSLGFSVVGKRPKYYEGKEDALLMTLFL